MSESRLLTEAEYASLPMYATHNSASTGYFDPPVSTYLIELHRENVAKAQDKKTWGIAEEQIQELKMALRWLIGHVDRWKWCCENSSGAKAQPGDSDRFHAAGCPWLAARRLAGEETKGK